MKITLRSTRGKVEGNASSTWNFYSSILGRLFNSEILPRSWSDVKSTWLRTVTLHIQVSASDWSIYRQICLLNPQHWLYSPLFEEERVQVWVITRHSKLVSLLWTKYKHGGIHAFFHFVCRMRQAQKTCSLFMRQVESNITALAQYVVLDEWPLPSLTTSIPMQWKRKYFT